MSSSAIPRENAPPRVLAAVRDRPWPVVVWGAMALWSVVLFGIVRDGFVNFRVGRFDLGNMVQAVWSTAEGRPLEITHGATGEVMTRLGGHVDPFLVLLAPLWVVWPSPLVLGLAQVVLVSLGALPVFWLARKHLESERTAGLLALAYLAYPWLAVTAAASIHPVTFAIPLFLFCVWFLDTGRLWPFAICAVLAMSTGELMGLPIAGLGIWYALARGRRLAGAVIAAAGAAWTFVAVYVVVKAFADGDDSIFYGFYEHVGGSPDGVVRTLLTEPGTVLSALFEAHDVIYVIWLGVPLLFLFVLSPGLALVALPQLLANWLSDFRSMTDPRYHSVAAVIPFLIAATVFGLRRIGPSRQASFAGAILVCSAAIALFVGPWARAIGMTPLGGRANVSQPRVEALAAAIALVPDDAAVTSSNVAGAHLSARRYVYTVPTLERATWVVVDRADPWIVSRDSPILTNHPEVVSAFVARLEDDPEWEPVFDRAGVVVFRKAST